MRCACIAMSASSTGSESTRDDLRCLGLQNVMIIPEGRDQPPDFNGMPKESVPTSCLRVALPRTSGRIMRSRPSRSSRISFSDAHLWIVGRGPLERKLKKMLPKGAEMLGYVPREELYERMARAHCLLVPSVREGWGLVVIEANSVGTPAVGYNVPGVRDSIQHGHTGLLAAAEDPAALARECLFLVNEFRRYSLLRTQAVKWADGFSWQITAEKLMLSLQAQAIISPVETLGEGLLDRPETGSAVRSLSRKPLPPQSRRAH